MIVTFGGAHKAQDGTPLAKRYYELDTSADLARYRAVSLFGDKWAFLYHDAEAAGASEYGLTQFHIWTTGWLTHDLRAHRDGRNCSTCSLLDEHGALL